ncbi:GNAT family N-acetyltransferase [Sphingobium sp. DEHP117]|uniref:GNAT family N-acetyltransferase n=1 Tax=Sphingobium sp. DEHP117 TaxID=2993436 RepID=UPI0027D60949|nr:GNAT family N-acetyltransferase [Sphingobium sp. DEHP117]MDQ4419213.1 GNAT family N-acetyltransferase [Sphingobium sp. DEHP117]
MASAPVAKCVAAAPSAQEWRALAECAAEPNPFYHPAILVPALRHLDEGAQVRMVDARDAGGRLIGLMPVMTKAHHARYRVKHSANWMHGQCFFGAPLMLAGAEAQAWSAILATLDQAGWAGHFLHFDGLDADGPVAAALKSLCAAQGRGCKRIASHERALLRSSLDADAYWQTHVRAKKRKEIRRLINRLEELGHVTHRRFAEGDGASQWAEDFITLEGAGWKGAEGTALGNARATRAFFRDAIANAAQDGLLDMLRIDIDGAPIAMLVNFRLGRGAFSYKIAFDETFARFSPGILIEIDNLRAALSDPDLDWMDSCAAPNHPMIDGIWAERRRIVQYRVALGGGGARGLARRAAFAGIGMVEDGISAVKGRRT